MLRLTLKSVRGHFGRFLLTLFAVTLGIAFLAGSLILTDGLRSTFDSIVEAGSRGTDVVVRGKQTTQVTAENNLSSRLPLSLQDELEQVDGVARVSADIQGSVLVVGKDGTAARNGGAPTLGFPYEADSPSLRLIAGEPPRGPDELALATSTLRRSGLSLGDRTQALIGQEPRVVTIVGEIEFDSALAGATLAVLDAAVAREAFSPDDAVPSFSLTAEEGVAQTDLETSVAAVLPAEAEALTGEELKAETKEQIGQALGFVNIFLLVFAGISLFVGAFIIWNTFSMLVAQRSRELALLRAVGASRSQVQRVVLGEAVVIGIVGSAVGLLAGIGLASGIGPLLETIGFEGSGDLTVRPPTVIWSFTVGILVTLVSAVVPAIRASRASPVAAMRDDIAITPKGVRGRGIVGLTMTALGVGLIVFSLRGNDVVWRVMGLGAALTLLGVIVASPLVTRPVVRVVALPFVALMGSVGRLARENSLRNPRRTAVTATALMIGLALMAGLSVVAESSKASVSDLVESQLKADFVLNGGGAAAFPGAVAEQVADLDGVESVAGIGGEPVRVGDDQIFAIAGESRAIDDNVVLNVTSGSLTALDGGKILIDESTAQDRGWEVGSTITATVGTSADESLTVGGVFEDSQVIGGQMIVPRALYQETVPLPQQGDFLVYVKAQDGADLVALRADLVETVKPFIVVSVQDGDEFTDSQSAQINQILAILYGLLALSVIIAVLGIINTLALSVLERTREVGLLRAVGLTKGQLFRMITVESVATAVFGALLGVSLGVGLGIALQRGLVTEGLESLAIPWALLAWMIALAAVAGLVAAILPAVRATRLDILRAITTE